MVPTWLCSLGAEQGLGRRRVTGVTDDDVQYEHQTVKSIRGREASTIADWERRGWELHRQDKGTLRSELTFRRVKVKSKIPAWLPIAGLLGFGVLLLGSVAIAEAFQSDDNAPESKETPSETVASSTPEPTEPAASEESSQQPVESDPAESEQPEPTEPAADEVLTVKSNQDLKTLLATSEDYALSKAFSKKYRGQKIEFDGNVAASGSHDGASTRFDFLIYTGDYSATVAAPGPAFQFRDVNFYDLNLQGRGSGVGMEDNLHIVAEVGEFEARTGLFLLSPVSTTLR